MDQPTWIGRTLGGRYKIDALLGQGGMSAVYKATDPNLKRVVAVKLIHSHLSADPAFVQRFGSEASAVASLRHPNIVQVFDFNNDGGTYYMVLEFIPGETLQDRLMRFNNRNRQLAIEDALKFTLNISDAVGYAHQRGMVHRDIKPANIMLDMQGGAILMDFGIVKIMGEESHTATGAVVGTARYLSPELARGEVADHRSDIYSLGVAMYEMLSGRPPFVADSAMTLMMMHLNDPVPDVRGFRPEIKPEIFAIVSKCLAKDRRDRYQSAAELSGDLKLALASIGEQSALKARAMTPASADHTVISERTALQSQTDLTIAQSQPKPKPADPVARKSNRLGLILAGGGAALLVCAVLGVYLFRNFSSKAAPSPTQAEIVVTTNTIEPVILQSTLTPEAPAEVQPTSTASTEKKHIIYPAVVVKAGSVVVDVYSNETGPEKRAPYGDSYQINLLERPFLQDMTYIPDLDIKSFNLLHDDTWYYATLELVGSNPNNPIGINYGVELDVDKDGFGDFLILAKPPYSTEWENATVQVFEDKDHDTAGKDWRKSDAPISGSGYDALLFDGGQGIGDDPDLAWVRHSGDNSIQIAFKHSWAGDVFMFGVLSDAGLKDVTKLDYVDRFTLDEAGSSVRDNPNYPLKALYAIDTTCRSANGFSSIGYEPRICPVIVQPSVATGSNGGGGGGQTGCQPPPGGCTADAPYWWPDPHCACSATPFNP